MTVVVLVQSQVCFSTADPDIAFSSRRRHHLTHRCSIPRCSNARRCSGVSSAGLCPWYTPGSNRVGRFCSSSRQPVIASATNSGTASRTALPVTRETSAGYGFCSNACCLHCRSSLFPSLHSVSLRSTHLAVCVLGFGRTSHTLGENRVSAWERKVRLPASSKANNPPSSCRKPKATKPCPPLDASYLLSRRWNTI